MAGVPIGFSLSFCWKYPASRNTYVREGKKWFRKWGHQEKRLETGRLQNTDVGGKRRQERGKRECVCG